MAILLVGFLVVNTFTSGATSPSAIQLHVSGNKLINADGSSVLLHGADRSGTEYLCVSGDKIFAGPTDQASITAMKNWGINAVRIPLNEACWNGEAYVKADGAGANYGQSIESYVRMLNSNGIVAILDLHWTDGHYVGKQHGCVWAKAFCQKPMPDSAESVPFWTSVASTFKDNDAVIFDLFNEPYPDQALPDQDAAWKCWLEGGSACSPGIVYPVAGMQTLVNAVRAAGANNVIMLGGLAHSTNLTQWLRYEPSDPDHNLVASWHSYKSNGCRNRACWAAQLGSLAKSVPVVAGEIGESDCADDYIDPLAAYLDSQSISYLAWAWNANFACSNSLITSYTGMPSGYGKGYKSHLESLGRGRQ
jgi:endoglucanase